jgi:hypothetical protein
MYVERLNFATIPALATSLINDLVSAGFVRRYGNNTAGTDTLATLECGSGNDPLYATQPWRIQIDGSVASWLNSYVGTSLQLPDTGAKNTGYQTLNNMYTNQGALPWSYILAVSTHGIVIYIWSPANVITPNYGGFNVGCVQRLVAGSNGSVLTTGHSPVVMFRVSLFDTLAMFSIIREDDISVPTTALSLTAATYAKVLFPPVLMSVVGLPSTDYNGNYVLLNLSGWTASRGLYQEELDMMMFANAGGFNTHQDYDFSAYGATRTYKSLLPMAATNAGYRFFLLRKIGGVEI